MRRAWARWRALSYDEKKCLLWMLILLPMISAMLRVFGFHRSHGWLQRASQPKLFIDADTTTLQLAERLARLADIAGQRGLVKATCLRQAMLLQWLLRRRQLDANLKIGTRLRDGEFDAHAWVELQGIALGQTEINHQAFDRW